MSHLQQGIIHFLILGSLTLASVQCGKNSFDKGAVTSGSAAVVQTTSTSNDRDVEANEADDAEATVASEPVAVGGAFLNCLFATTQSSSDIVSVQCEFSSQTLESVRAQDLLYGFTTGASRAQATALPPDREEFTHDIARQVWSWNFYFKRPDIREGWIYVDIQDKARKSDPIIKSDVAIPALAAPSATPAPEGLPSLLRFNSGPQKLGDDGAGVGVEAACAATDKTTIAMARSRTYSVTLSTETTLNLSFSNLCGVGTGQTNTAGSFTTAALRNASGTAVFQFNLANQAKLTYVSAKIPAGVYSLIITPASRNGALNDFVYSDLLIEGAGIQVK